MLSTLALAIFLQLPQEPCKAQDPTISTIGNSKITYDKPLVFTAKLSGQDNFLDRMLKQHKEKYNLGDDENDSTKEYSKVLPGVLFLAPESQEFNFPKFIPDTWPKAKLKKIPLTWENLKVIETGKTPKK